MTIQTISFQTQTYTFTDEESMSAADKQQILADWQRFIYHGFNKLFFTAALHRYLTHHCGFSPRSRESFWAYYYSSEISHLKTILNQYGGDRRGAETGDHDWLRFGGAVDLKAALCEEVRRVYQPLLQVLNDLEYRHEEILSAWHQFALSAGIEDVALPPLYTVSENTRNLLAYAAAVALKQARPPLALQMRFPVHQLPLYVTQSQPVVEVRGGQHAPAI